MKTGSTENRRTWLTRWLLELCGQDSTSGREDALLPALRALLEELGAEIHEQPVSQGRTNVLALWGEPRVLFSTHLDTVPPFIPPVLEGDILRGRGACEAKGQIAAQLGAARELLQDGVRHLAWLGVVGEETDSAGARAALDLSGRLEGCRAVICGEPTGLKLATGQRGIRHYVLRCRGRAAHSSQPEAGNSALWPLLDWLQRLRELRCAEDPELGPESWDLGLLQGGRAINVVPDYAEAHLMVRAFPGGCIDARVRNLAPPEGEVELRLWEPHDRYPRLRGFEHAPMPFGSDAPCLRKLATDGMVVLAGPGSIRMAHGPDEFISLDELEAGVALNDRLARRFLRACKDSGDVRPAKRGPVRHLAPGNGQG